MIVFDGVNIEDVAGVRIEDIRVGPVEINPVTRSRAVQPGAVFVRNRYGTRTVAVTFALPIQNREERQQALSDLAGWAKSDAEHMLELPGRPEQCLMAVCTAKPEPSMRQWWESKLRIVFTCFDDPFWISKAQNSTPCGKLFTVDGNVPPLLWIERDLTAAAQNQSYTLDGNTMTFSTIPAGHLVIDLNRQTASVGSASIMQYYNINSKFLIPRTGAQTIQGKGRVYFRGRWE